MWQPRDILGTCFLASAVHAYVLYYSAERLCTAVANSALVFRCQSDTRSPDYKNAKRAELLPPLVYCMKGVRCQCAPNKPALDFNERNKN